ncbi:unnamed protein product, partial [Ectocarpus sp. 8 AP-2014]
GGETDASTFSAATGETSLSREIILGRGPRKQERISPTAAEESEGQESGELSVSVRPGRRREGRGR